MWLQFVALTQPINALAFVFDGLHYGASDFEYAAVSMVSAEYSLIIIAEGPTLVSCIRL